MLNSALQATFVHDDVCQHATEIMSHWRLLTSPCVQPSTNIYSTVTVPGIMMGAGEKKHEGA